MDMTPGNPIASGYMTIEDPSKAMDDDATTFWTACLNCNETRKYWIGMELPANAEDAQAEQFFIRCFKVWQSEQMQEQVVSVQVQIWNGEIYIMSPITQTGSLQDLGGGVWSRPAASFMTRWRLKPAVQEDRNWRLLELELYADSGCRQRLPRADRMGGGTTVLASSYRPFVTGFRRSEQAKLWSEAELATDGDIETGVLLEHMPGLSREAYFGVDFLSGSVWVRCVKLMQGSMPVEYVPSLTLQLWDGLQWRHEDPEMSQFEVHLDGLGGGGWQRRPAQPGSMWRVENADFVPQGWALYEVEFLGNT